MPSIPPAVALSCATLVVTAAPLMAQDAATGSQEPVPNEAASGAPESPEAVQTYTGPEWTVDIEPALGLLSPAGDVTLPSSTTQGGEFELDSLSLDSARLSPMGRFTAARRKFRFSISGLGFSASDRGSTAGAAGQIGGAAFAAGDRLVSDLSYESFDLLVGYRVLHRTSDNNDAGVPRVEAGLDVLGGLRFHHADFDVDVVAAVPPAPGAITGAEADELFAEPVVGVRGELEFARTFVVDVESLIGGFTTGDRSSVSFSIEAGFEYRPIPALGLRIGYRMLVFDFNDGEGAGEFDWRGSVAGVYWGASLRF